MHLRMAGEVSCQSDKSRMGYLEVLPRMPTGSCCLPIP